MKATRSQIKAELAKRDFGFFMRETRPKLVQAEFHRALDTVIQDFITGGGFYMVYTPPQHGKSTRISESMPAAIYAHDPTENIILGSYAESLAASKSRAVRALIRSVPYKRMFPYVSIAAGQNRATDWKLDGGGSFRAVGVSGGATGNPANRIIIDDAFKDRDQAESPAYRRKVFDAFSGSFRSRLTPSRKGLHGIFIINTRWHVHDLSGQLKQVQEKNPDADQYIVFRFPAVRDDDRSDAHPMDTRELGEALWPEKVPIKELNARRALSERDYVSLYQGKPVEKGGNIFKRHWLRHYVQPCRPQNQPTPIRVRTEDDTDVDVPQIIRPDDIVSTTISIDAAFKGLSGSDFCAIAVFSKDSQGRHFLVDMINKRMGYPVFKRRVMEMIEKHIPGKILIEDAANGPAIISELREKYSKDFVEPRPTLGGKIARAHAVSSRICDGMIYIPHPRECTWVQDLIDQMTQFPAVDHDDMVDAVTHYIAWVLEHAGSSGWLSRITQKKA